ncbi:MAG: flagellar basal body-associated FliL family protein [Rickettsiales bacterium]
MSHEEDKGQEGQKKSKKLLFIIAAVTLFGVLAGGGAFFLGVFGNGKSDDSHAEEATAGEEASQKEAHGGGPHGKDAPNNGLVYYDLQEMIVNLNVGSASPSFLKMKVSLELANPLDVPAVEAQLPRISDSFQVYIRELRRSDLQGSEGIYRLREELLLRINKILYPVKVKDILFKEILIQ